MTHYLSLFCCQCSLYKLRCLSVSAGKHVQISEFQFCFFIFPTKLRLNSFCSRFNDEVISKAVVRWRLAAPLPDACLRLSPSSDMWSLPVALLFFFWFMFLMRGNYSLRQFTSNMLNNLAIFWLTLFTISVTRLIINCQWNLFILSNAECM